MFGIIDRYILRSFLVAYGIWVVTILGFYVVVDAFNHLETFSEAERPFVTVLRYYAFHVPLIFYRLAPFILLIAAIFAVTWLNRQNELVPVLSAGRSPLRALLPIFAATVVLTGASAALQELLIPSLRHLGEEFADRRRRDRTSPGPLADGLGGTFRVETFDRATSEVRGVHYTRRQGRTVVEEIFAARGRWLPESSSWELTGGANLRIDAEGEPRVDARGNPDLRPFEGDRYVLRTDVAPPEIALAMGDALTASTAEIWNVASRRPGMRHLRVQAHARMAYPLCGLVLLLVGLPFAARVDARDVYQAVLLCVVVSGAYFFCDFVFQDLALQGSIPESLGGWFAPLVFGGIGVLGALESAGRRRKLPVTPARVSTS